MIGRLALAGLTLAAALHAASAAETSGASKPEEVVATEAAPAAEPGKAKVAKRRSESRRGSVAKPVEAEAAASSAPEPVAASTVAAEAEAKPETKPAPRKRAPRAVKAKPHNDGEDAATEPAAAAEPAAPTPVEVKTEMEPTRKVGRTRKGKLGRAETAKAPGDASAEAAPAETAAAAPVSSRDALDALIAAHAKANGLPASLVHRVVHIESRHNPKAIGRGGVYGLMQIKTPTARALGYSGGPTGLLDAETNLTYGVRYLAGAYKVAGGNETRAYSFYRSGYYYAAKRKGLHKEQAAPVEVASAEPPPEPASRSSLWSTASRDPIDPAR